MPGKRFVGDTQPAMEDRITAAARSYAAQLDHGDAFIHVGRCAVPAAEAIVRFVDRARGVLFPGYFCPEGVSAQELPARLERDVGAVHADVLALVTACVRHEQHQPTGQAAARRAREVADAFVDGLGALKTLLDADVRAAYDGDPAAKSFDEIILSYPGLFALTVHRVAHALHRLAVPLLPRMMNEYAHGRTGIDIHPGARIGRSFFVDHGTGVVIGETTEIGDRVRVYQGVTLGAISLPRDAGPRYRHQKRHPTIEDDVIIYANATILGGDTVIGARTIIGGNNWITESVPADSKVVRDLGPGISIRPDA